MQTKMNKIKTKKYLVYQKIMGIVFLIITALILFVASTGVDPVTQDGTFALISLPLGLYLIFTKNIVIYTGRT